LIIRLVRHGETDWNRIKRIQGQRQVSLNEEGIAQSLEIEKELRLVNIDEIYSSDLKRSIQTATIINRSRGMPITKLSGLREMNYGDWEGRMWEDIYRDNPYLNESWESLGNKFKAIGGESASQFRKRVTKTFENMVTTTTASNILIVSHAQVMKMILLCFREVRESEIFTFMEIDNCSVLTVNSEEIQTYRSTILSN